VALDNGDIVGFAAEDYLKSQQTRKFSSPVFTIDQARTKINPNLKVMEERKAVILNKLKEEVLCYEFLGVMGEDTYRIFINAENGHEEEVQKLKNAERLYQDVM
jgi:spore germination protein